MIDKKFLLISLILIFILILYFINLEKKEQFTQLHLLPADSKPIKSNHNIIEYPHEKQSKYIYNSDCPTKGNKKGFPEKKKGNYAGCYLIEKLNENTKNLYGNIVNKVNKKDTVNSFDSCLEESKKNPKYNKYFGFIPKSMNVDEYSNTITKNNLNNPYNQISCITTDLTGIKHPPGNLKKVPDVFCSSIKKDGKNLGGYLNGKPTMALYQDKKYIDSVGEYEDISTEKIDFTIDDIIEMEKDCIFIGGNQLLECNLTQDNDINYTGSDYYLKDYSSNKHHIKTNLTKKNNTNNNSILFKNNDFIDLSENNNLKKKLNEKYNITDKSTSFTIYLDYKSKSNENPLFTRSFISSNKEYIYKYSDRTGILNNDKLNDNYYNLTTIPYVIDLNENEIHTQHPKPSTDNIYKSNGYYCLSLNNNINETNKYKGYFIKSNTKGTTVELETVTGPINNTTLGNYILKFTKKINSNNFYIQNIFGAYLHAFKDSDNAEVVWDYKKKTEFRIDMKPKLTIWCNIKGFSQILLIINNPINNTKYLRSVRHHPYFKGGNPVSDKRGNLDLTTVDKYFRIDLYRVIQNPKWTKLMLPTKDKKEKKEKQSNESTKNNYEFGIYSDKNKNNDINFRLNFKYDKMPHIYENRLLKINPIVFNKIKNYKFNTVKNLKYEFNFIDKNGNKFSDKFKLYTNNIFKNNTIFCSNDFKEELKKQTFINLFKSYDNSGIEFKNLENVKLKKYLLTEKRYCLPGTIADKNSILEDYNNNKDINIFLDKCLNNNLCAGFTFNSDKGYVLKKYIDGYSKNDDNKYKCYKKKYNIKEIENIENKFTEINLLDYDTCSILIENILINGNNYEYELEQNSKNMAVIFINKYNKKKIVVKYGNNNYTQFINDTNNDKTYLLRNININYNINTTNNNIDINKIDYTSENILNINYNFEKELRKYLGNKKKIINETVYYNYYAQILYNNNTFKINQFKYQDSYKEIETQKILLNLDGKDHYGTPYDSNDWANINKYSILQNRPDLTFYNEFSISLWIYPKKYNDAYWYRLIGKGNQKRNYCIWLWGNAENANNNGKIEISLYGLTNSTLQVNNKVPLNAWTHIALTYRKNAVSIVYINSINVYTNMNKYNTGTLNTPEEGEHLEIGVKSNKQDGEWGKFHGKMNRIRIYGKELSHLDIQKEFKKGPMGNENNYNGHITICRSGIDTSKNRIYKLLDGNCDNKNTNKTLQRDIIKPNFEIYKALVTPNIRNEQKDYIDIKLINNNEIGIYNIPPYGILTVGPSDNNTKIIKLSRRGLTFIPQPANNQYNWPDKFKLKVDDNILSVERIDKNNNKYNGWQQNLQFKYSGLNKLNFMYKYSKKKIYDKELDHYNYKTLSKCDCYVKYISTDINKFFKIKRKGKVGSIKNNTNIGNDFKSLKIDFKFIKSSEKFEIFLNNINTGLEITKSDLFYKDSDNNNLKLNEDKIKYFINKSGEYSNYEDLEIKNLHIYNKNVNDKKIKINNHILEYLTNRDKVLRNTKQNINKNSIGKDNFKLLFINDRDNIENQLNLKNTKSGKHYVKMKCYYPK